MKIRIFTFWFYIPTNSYANAIPFEVSTLCKLQANRQLILQLMNDLLINCEIVTFYIVVRRPVSK
jgi:hypothetical protein